MNIIHKNLKIIINTEIKFLHKYRLFNYIIKDVLI